MVKDVLKRVLFQYSIRDAARVVSGGPSRFCTPPFNTPLEMQFWKMTRWAECAEKVFQYSIRDAGTKYKIDECIMTLLSILH